MLQENILSHGHMQSTCVNLLWQVMEGFFPLQLFHLNICIWVMVSALGQADSDALFICVVNTRLQKAWNHGMLGELLPEHISM